MRNIKLGSLLGIPILVNPSWFLLLGLLTWLLAAEIFPASYEDASNVTYAAMAGISAFLFFASIVLHELAHSVVAKAYKIPVKSITLFIFGGVAQITREAKKPAAELYMAAAGPLMSMLLGIAFLGVWWALGADDSRAVDHVLFWLAITNAALAIFNLIPAFPMDGGRVFRSIIWLITRNYYRATAVAGWTGRFFAWAMIGAGFASVLGINTYIADNPIGGMWLVLIGWFLENAARQSLVQSRIVKTLEEYRTTDLMVADPPVVEGEATVGSLARGVIEINPRICYFVEDHGKLAGIISAYQMASVPEAAWDRTTASEAMLPSAKLTAVAPDRPLSEVLVEMESADVTHLPVVREGRVVGVIGRDRILGVLRNAGFLRTANAG
jgi:Zn-dependent protease/CBS domain-containing protein